MTSREALELIAPLLELGALVIHTIEAISVKVGFWKTSATVIERPASLAAPTISIAMMESPPSSKKLSSPLIESSVMSRASLHSVRSFDSGVLVTILGLISLTDWTMSLAFLFSSVGLEAVISAAIVFNSLLLSESRTFLGLDGRFLSSDLMAGTAGEVVGLYWIIVPVLNICSITSCTQSLINGRRSAIELLSGCEPCIWVVGSFLITSPSLLLGCSTMDWRTARIFSARSLAWVSERMLLQYRNRMPSSPGVTLTFTVTAYSLGSCATFVSKDMALPSIVSSDDEPWIETAVLKMALPDILSSCCTCAREQCWCGKLSRYSDCTFRKTSSNVMSGRNWMRQISILMKAPTASWIPWTGASRPAVK